MRKIDPARGGRVFGGDQDAFWTNVPDGPALACKTRLRLWLGQWFLNPTDGTAWSTRVLGRFTGSTRDAEVRGRILGTPGVTQIVSYSSSLDRDTREWSFNATIDTAYGRTTIAGTL